MNPGEMIQEAHFIAHGHINVMATHPTTIEVTAEDHLTLKGDCIVAVSAEKGLNDLPDSMRRAAKNNDTVIRLILEAEEKTVIVTGRGDPTLTWEHPTDMVARTSGYVSGRTLMVHADKAARDLPIDFLSRLKNPKTIVRLAVQVETL